MTVETIFPLTLILATLFCTLVTGLLFAFAIVAMPGLNRLHDREFIRAFQEMDGIIQRNHPLFILVWGGSAVLLLLAAVLGFGQLGGFGQLLLIAATLVYIFGVQVPTITVNVPLNNRLQALNVDSVNEAAQLAARHAFEPRWNQWNAIRTVFATLASTLLLILLFLL